MTKPARGQLHILEDHAALTRVLETAPDEEWEELVILPRFQAAEFARVARLPPTAIVLVAPSLATHVEELAKLQKLRYLHLQDETLGSTEVRRIVNALRALSSLKLRVGELDRACLVTIGQALSSLTSLDLSNHDIGPEGAREIAESLPGLTSLNLSRNRVGTKGAIAIGRSLRNLVSLDLAHNDVGTEGAAAIARSLTSLRTLNLSWSGIGTDGALAIANTLGALTSLELARNEISTPGAVVIADQLRSLASLDLSGNPLGTEGARAIAAFLNALTSLRLWGAQIGTLGAFAISESLHALASLDLDANDIDRNGAAAVAGSLRGLTSLSLSRNKIGTVGAVAIAEGLPSLTSLRLADCDIEATGAIALGSSMKVLTALELSENPIGASGAAAISSPALTSLELRNAGIGDEGALAIANSLPALTALDLSGNALGDNAAAAIARLTGLTSLTLWDNQIEDSGAIAISQSLNLLCYLNLGANHIGARGALALAGSLSNLEALNLEVNPIGDEGAVGIASSLPNLTVLTLGRCNIGNKGAGAIAKSLRSLRWLRLSSNVHIDLDGVRQLLDAIERWPDKGRHLKRLELGYGQDLSALFPEELLRDGNAQALLSAYRREGAPLNEVKLLVVGNEGVGKTSLIRYLKDGAPRDPGELKTPGVVVNEKIAIAKWAPTKSHVAVNIWDFGGQEIMHGTHRYFLTKRSLYIIVLEARREDSQDEALDHWLRVIKDRGGDSPVVVVVNKAEPEHLYHPNEVEFRRAYPNIANFARTTCNVGDAARIQSLREQLIAVIEDDPRLHHVRDRIPIAWLKVKHELEELASRQKTVTYEQYVGLCNGAKRLREHRVTESAEQKGLLRLLNDLGVVIAHGIDTDAVASMREVTLLDPNWLTQAIYRVLNSPQLRDQQGVFDGRRLDQFLDSHDYPAERFEFIVDMMQHPEIGLCFELPDKRGSYLVPEALPKHEPEGVWPGQEPPLRFCYVYGLLPSGLIPRLIVLAHALLNPERLCVWKEGAIFNVDSCKVLVRGDRVRRRVDLYVFGPRQQRREALSVMRDYLSRVHALHKALEEQPRVPLPDKPETTVSYEYLVEREQAKGSHYSWKPEGAD